MKPYRLAPHKKVDQQWCLQLI